jgi:FtsH ternary system domain X1
MSAADTASQVLAWTAGEEMSGGRVPEGTLAGLAELADPPAGLRAAIGQVAAMAAARLRLPAPPLGDVRPPGPAVAILAAAVGARTDPAVARRALDMVAGEDAEAAYELAARHAVASRALRSGQLDDATAGLLREASPLTAVLDHPAGSGELTAEDLLETRLLPDPDGYRLAVRTFAAPAGSAAQAAWRASRLSRYRLGRWLPFVLDVYETGMTVFGAAHRHRLELVRALLGQAPDLDMIRPLVQWWQPLSEIERRRPQEIRQRRLISNDYVGGVRAYRRFAALETAAAMAAREQGEEV